MSGLSRRELESTKVDLRRWSQRLVQISEELTALSADLGRARDEDARGDDGDADTGAAGPSHRGR